MNPFLTWLLAGALYTLPQGAAAPDAAQTTRIDRAIEAIGGADLRRRQTAVRELALIGEPVLARVVERLNRGDASERALLLTALSRLPAARPLLDQARRDPDPAVRAIVSPARREPESLARLSARYIDLLATSRDAKRKQVTEQLKGLKPVITRPGSQYDLMRKHRGDRRLDRALDRRYKTVSLRLARAAAAALRAGTLQPDLDDPVFVAFLGLLYDEEVAAVDAVEALIAIGEPAAPALLELMARGNHDPRVVARILTAIGRGADVMGLDVERDSEARFAQIELADRALPAAAAVVFLSGALSDDTSRQRKEALSALLRLGAKVPKQTVLARADEFGDDEWTRAIDLLHRAGDAQAIPEAIARGGVARRGAFRLLHRLDAKSRAAYLPALLASEDAGIRFKGVDLTDDPKALLEIARASDEPRLRLTAVRRAIRFGDASGVSLLSRSHQSVVRALRENGFVDELVAIALAEDADASRMALMELRHVTAIDAKHEAPLLAYYNAHAEPFRWDALDALVALGTPGVVAALEAAGDHAVSALGIRADDGHAIPFSFPLGKFLKGADAERLQKLGRIAVAMEKLEQGFYLRLLEAWDRLDAQEADVDGGSAGQKVDAIRLLVRAADPHSVRVLFGRVLAGELREERVVLPILQAAARQLPNKTLAALIPKLQVALRTYYPDAQGNPPDANPPRDYFVFYAIRALAYRRVEAALDPLVRVMLDPSMQRARYDEQSGRDLPLDWPMQACEALRHYSPDAVGKTLRGVIAEMEADGSLAELTPAHLLHLLAIWRSSGWRGRRLHTFALVFCDLLDRLPFEGETGVDRMLALGTQRRFVDASAAGRAAAASLRARGFAAADGFWSPRRIEGRARLYAGLAQGQAAECVPELGGDPYLIWLAAVCERYSLADPAAAREPAKEAWRRTAWLDRDKRNLRADLLTIGGQPDAARALLEPSTQLPLEVRQSEGWHRFYLARSYAAAGHQARAKGELAEGLRMTRRLLSATAKDPLLKDYAEVYRQADEDFFDRLFTD